MELSTKPYLLRAIHDWCTDAGFTPYLAVAVDESVRVPAAFVKNGEIVLNISALATNRLKLGNEAVEFSARFGGVATDPAASATPEASGSRASSSAATRAARRLFRIAGLAQLVEQPPCKR
jgi:hypothetical protein